MQWQLLSGITLMNYKRKGHRVSRSVQKERQRILYEEEMQGFREKAGSLARNKYLN